MLTHDAILSIAVAAPIPQCGIYFLIRGGRINYVGQSVNIPMRIAAHLATKQFDSWAWVSCDRADLSAMERAYINEFMPEDNRDHVTERRRNPPPAWMVNLKEQALEAARQTALEQETEKQWMDKMRLVARSLG
jgi:hypothetical protein